MTDTSTKYDTYELNDIYAEVDNPDDPEVLLGIAHHYRDGNGVEKNPELYMNYLNKSAKAGNEKAVAELHKKDSESSETKSEPTQAAKKSSVQNGHLTGKESVSELIRMTETGNPYAALELLKKSYSLPKPDQSMINKCRIMLHNYVEKGKPDAVKGDVAYQAGNIFAEHNEHIRSQGFYEAGSKCGNDEATVKLIPILCKDGKSTEAYEAYRTLHHISDKQRVRLLKILSYYIALQHDSPLLVKGLCEELTSNPAATEKDKECVDFRITLASEGWKGVFNHWHDPYYAKQIANYFNNKERINYLTKEQFGILLDILRQGDQTYLMSFLSYCIAYGNYTIRGYITDVSVSLEFKNGTLINYLMSNPNSRYGPTSDTNTNYEQVIYKYKVYQRRYYDRHLSEMMNDPDSYEKIKEIYFDPDNLSDYSDHFQTLLDFFRKHNDKDAVIQLLGTALLTTKEKLFRDVINSPEFRNGDLNDFMAKSAKTGNIGRARDYYSDITDTFLQRLKNHKLF